MHACTCHTYLLFRYPFIQFWLLPLQKNNTEIFYWKKWIKERGKKTQFHIGYSWTRIYICFYVYTMVITAHEVFWIANKVDRWKAKSERRGGVELNRFLSIFLISSPFSLYWYLLWPFYPPDLLSDIYFFLFVHLA